MKYFLILLAVVVLAIVGMYLVNPHGTNTLDPRARIVGYIPYVAPSESMEPTVKRNSYLIAQTSAYGSKTPDRFDLVVFKPPHDTRVWFARVIANEGETVQLIDGKL